MANTALAKVGLHLDAANNGNNFNAAMWSIRTSELKQKSFLGIYSSSIRSKIKIIKVHRESKSELGVLLIWHSLWLLEELVHGIKGTH